MPQSIKPRTVSADSRLATTGNGKRSERPDLQGLHPNLVLLTDELKFHVLGDRARSQLAARPGYYSLLVSLSGMLVFAQDRGLESTGPRARVLMAGEIISSSTVVDVIGMLASHRWRGELQIVTGTTLYQLMINQGILQYAASNRADDELVNWLADIVPLHHLQQVHDELLPGQRFEDAVLQRALLTEEQLLARAEGLSRKVFFDALTLADGKYAFVVLPESLDTAPPLSLQLRIQEMLLLGVERIDEFAYFRQRIPHGQVRPFIVEHAGVAIEDPHQRMILTHADGKRTLDEIARVAGLVEFECLKATHELMEAGHIELHIEEIIDDYAIHALLTDFDSVLRSIANFVLHVGRGDTLRDSLLQWLRSSGFGNYLGEGLARTLQLDAEEISEQLRLSRVDEPVQTLKQALFELVTFAMFVTSTLLPEKMALQLSDHVQQTLHAISDRWQ
jgi:hypothetical protein